MMEISFSRHHPRPVPPQPSGATLSLIITPVISTWPSVPDTTPLGANLATLQGVWSDSSPFTGSYVFVAPYFDDGGVYAVTMNPDHSGNLIINPLGPGVNLGGGTVENISLIARQGSSGGTIVDMKTLTNTSGSSIAAGAYSPPFALWFADSDTTGIPLGTWFDLQVSGVSQPHSYGLQTYHPSGRLKWVAVWFKTTFVATPGSSTTVNVVQAASPPTASGRTLTDVYAQNIVGGHAVGLMGISGTWNSYLINGDPNILQTFKYADGQAGAAFFILSKCAQTPGGTADGWLQHEHYIYALGAGGSPDGFRWHGALVQPDYNSGAGTNPQRVFSSIGWSINGGAVTPVPNQMTARAFTISGNSISTNTAHNFWLGQSIAGNCIPVVLSGLSGCAPLNTTTCYYVQPHIAPTVNPTWDETAIPSDNGVTLYDTANMSGAGVARNVNGDGSMYGLYQGFSTVNVADGTGTMTPVYLLNPFNRLSFMTSDCKYNYFTPGASAPSADFAFRITFDQTYAVSTLTILPFALDQIGNVTDTNYFGAYASGYNFAWNPYNVGDLFNAQDTAGDHTDLGPLPNIAARDFYVQSNNTDRVIRYYGLAGGLTPWGMRDASTHSIINVLNSSYTGLPGTQATTFSIRNGAPAAPNASLVCSMAFNEKLCDHKPQYSYYAYWKTGELQYLRLLVEQANGGALQAWPVANQAQARNLTIGATTYYGLTVSETSGETRSAAWGTRDVALAAGAYPRDPTGAGRWWQLSDTTGPTATLPIDGTQTGQYLLDMIDSNRRFVIACMTSGNNVWHSATNYITTTGAYLVNDVNNFAVTHAAGSPGFSYMYMAWIWDAILSQSADSRTLLSYASTWMNHINTTFGAWHLANYFMEYSMTTPVVDSAPITDIITTDTFLAFETTNATDYNGSPGLNYSTSGSPYFGPFPPTHNDYTPGNGDKFIPFSNDGSTNPFSGGPTELDPKTPYYIVNWDVSTRMFDFSLSKGGAPVVISNHSGNTQMLGWYMVAGTDAAHAPQTGGAAFPDTGYINYHVMNARVIKAISARLGTISPDITPVETAVQGLMTGWVTELTLQSGLQVPRYCMQDHF